MSTNFTDRAELHGTRLLSDGYLSTVAKAVRTGIQLYAGSEVGRPDMAVVRVYRPADEVMNADSLQSFSHAPVTMDHPAEAVSPDNWRDLAVGEVSTAAKVDADGWVQLPLVLKDGAAIQQVQAGKRELSAGYTCELEWGDGVTPTGEEYHAVQRNIRINHLAVVDRARAGSDARIGDKWGATPLDDETKTEADMATKVIMVDGLSVETTDAGAAAIEKVVGERDTARKELADAKAEHDKSMAKVEAERDALKDSQLSDADLDKRVAARGDLIATAKKLAPNVVTDGKPDLDIKRAVLAERKVSLDGKSDAYVEARFDTLIEDHAESDSTAAALGDTKPAGGGNDNTAQSAYVGRLTRKAN